MTIVSISTAEFRRSLSKQHKRKISEALKRGRKPEDPFAGSPAQQMAASNKGRFGFKNVAVGYNTGPDKRLYAHSIYRGPLGLVYARGGQRYRMSRQEERRFKSDLRKHLSK